MAKPDLVAEHARLIAEREEIWRLIVAEWTTMSAQVAQQRERRVLEIGERLKVIERTKTWERRE